MEGLFQLDLISWMGFVIVLFRIGVTLAVFPVFGNTLVPSFIKVLFAISVSFTIYPSLIKLGLVQHGQTAIWCSTLMGLVSTVMIEVLVGICLGFVARLSFDAIQMAGHFIGNAMGFSIASTYDPQQDSQTLVVAEFQNVCAMLLFLALDGHQLLLSSLIQSYSILGVGQAVFDPVFTQTIVAWFTKAFWFAVQLSAPATVILFVVNGLFGILSRTMPQINILPLSLGISALVGLVLLGLSQMEAQSMSVQFMAHSADWVKDALKWMRGV